MPRWTIEDTLALYDAGLIPGPADLRAFWFCEHCGKGVRKEKICHCPLGLRDYYEAMEKKDRDRGDLSRAFYWHTLFSEAGHDWSGTPRAQGGHLAL